MIKKADVDERESEIRYRAAKMQAEFSVGIIKTQMRDDLAAKIVAGICAGDWKFDLSDGKKWDELAVARAYQIADAMIKEREVSNV